MMNEEDIKNIIANEMVNCSGDEWVNRKNLAMSYYNGHEPRPSGIKGRSEVVSTDVADACHWLLPNIVEWTATDGILRDFSLGLLLVFNCVIIVYFIFTLVHARLVWYGWLPHPATSAVTDALAAGPAPPAVPDNGGESGRLR